MNDDTTLQHELDRLQTRLPDPPPPARLLAQVARTRTRRRRRAAFAGVAVVVMLLAGVGTLRSVLSPAPTPGVLAGGTGSDSTSHGSASGPAQAAPRGAWRAFGRADDWHLSDADAPTGGGLGPAIADATPRLRPFRPRDVADLVADMATERRDRDQP
jgi:hypothetical protein